MIFKEASKSSLKDGEVQALQEDLATAEVSQGGAPDDELQGGLDDSLFDVDDLLGESGDELL